MKNDKDVNDISDELIKRLESLYSSWASLSELSGSLPRNLKDVCNEQYPFQKNFNDLSVDIFKWVENVKKTLA